MQEREEAEEQQKELMLETEEKQKPLLLKTEKRQDKNNQKEADKTEDFFWSYAETGART